jgi:o-succinylbenzoate---CoA ligase
MFQIHYQKRIYSQTQDFQNVQEELPDFVQEAFSFCEAWLSGEQNFSQATSGSTGIPKRISINRNQMIASAEATGSFFSASPNWKMLCCLNPAYIAGKMMLARAMVWDCEIELVAPSSHPFISALNDSYDFVAMVPLQVNTTLGDSRTCAVLKSTQNLIIGGAPISNTLQKQLLHAGINAYQTFGMTETVSHIALAPISEGELIYRILPGVEIGINAHSLLWVKSTISGPEAIQTNDEVLLLSEDQFKWLGRADFVINSGGVKLHPERLEQKAHELIENFFPGASFFFSSLQDDNLGQKLVLYLETDFSDEKKVSDLKNSLKSKMDRFEVPREIILLKKFQRTSTGKLDRINTTLQE